MHILPLVASLAVPHVKINVTQWKYIMHINRLHSALTGAYLKCEKTQVYLKQKYFHAKRGKLPSS